MRRKRMAIMSLDSTLSLPQVTKNPPNPSILVEEIGGLIRVYKDGHVERTQIVPRVSCTLPPELEVTCRDLVIDRLTDIWARFYVPTQNYEKVPLLVYFHGGGFCVGSASWSCYHEFLALLSSKVGCVIMSVDYRLAPENPLPAAYEDGQKALMWVKQQALSGSNQQWLKQCDFSNVFLAGDSAGGNIAHNVTLRSRANWENLKPLIFKGNILIQPFFGGETRTGSETLAVQPSLSVLNLIASDTYWRLSLPKGANRDHPWCNPGAKGSIKLERMAYNLPTMVCVSEMDILKDRNMEFCGVLGNSGIQVEHVVYKGVGHAFQILDKSRLSQIRTQEMISHIKAFINKRNRR